MVFPLMLAGLGLLAGNEMFRQRRVAQREEDVAAQFRGLLGAPGGEMGPPTEGGQMGYSGGYGLLSDPRYSGNPEIALAAGITGLPGQQQPGLTMLNAAMQRAQQQQQYDTGNQQWREQFARGGEQFAQGQQNWRDQFAQQALHYAQGQQNWQDTFGAGRQDQQGSEARWLLDYQQRQKEFELRQQQAAAAGAPGGADMPKLPAGYGWIPDGKGGAMAAPVQGTPDYAKGVEGMQGLNDSVRNIGNLLDLFAGKETRTGAGKLVRQDGHGYETRGEIGAQYSEMRSQIIADVAKLRGMGVLQEGEWKRIEEMLPDLTSYGGVLHSNETTAAGYESLRKRFSDKLDAHLQANPWLIPALPPGFAPVGKGGAASPGTKARAPVPAGAVGAPR